MSEKNRKIKGRRRERLIGYVCSLREEGFTLRQIRDIVNKDGVFNVSHEFVRKLIHEREKELSTVGTHDRS